MPKKKLKRELTPYEQRLHNNWLRRQEKQFRAKNPKVETVAYSKENLQLHWQDQAALDEQHRRELALQKKKRDLKRRKREQKEAVENWIKANNDNQVDVQALAKVWEDTAKKHRNRFLELAIKAFATVDAGSQANDAMRLGLKMDGAEIDLKDLSALVVRFMRVEIGESLCKHLPVSKRIKEQIMDRIVAREFPTKDSRPLPSARRKIDPNAAIMDAIKKEFQSFEKP